MTVPSLTGMTCAQASTTLQSAHFQSVCAPGTTTTPSRPPCSSCGRSTRRQNPTKAPYGSTITLVPSLGHEPATVPSIPTSYTFAQAQAALQAVGLTATQNPEPSTTVPVGTGHLDVAGQRGAGALRLGGDGQRLDRTADDECPTSCRTRWPRPRPRCRAPGLTSRACRAARTTTSSAPSPRSARRSDRARPSSSSPMSPPGWRSRSTRLRPLRGGASLGMAPRG